MIPEGCSSHNNIFKALCKHGVTNGHNRWVKQPVGAVAVTAPGSCAENPAGRWQPQVPSPAPPPGSLESIVPPT